MTVTIQRTTYYKHADADVGKRREEENLSRVLHRLFALVSSLERYERTSERELVLTLKQSHANHSQDVFTFIAGPETITLLEQLAYAGDRMKKAKRESLFQMMVDRDGTEFYRMHVDEVDNVERNLLRGPLPWQVMATLYVFKIALKWETIARWSNYSRLQDFLEIVVMARDEGRPFEDVEREFGPMAGVKVSS